MWNTLKRIGNWLDQILNPITMEQLTLNALADIETLRAQLAQAEIELADKAFYVREFAAVSAEREALRVGWENSHRAEDELDALKAEIAALRERASVPVPAGVPEVKALREIGINAYLMHEQAKRENAGCIVGPMEAAASAIRDAVLTGVAQPSSNAGQLPTDDQVEALARVLHKANTHGLPWTQARSGRINEARAAIAHLSKRPEGLPTAEELKAAHMKYVEGYRKGENDGSMCATDFALEYLTPFLRMPMEANQ